MTNILMIALEPGRWGPARLIFPLSESGFHIAVLCPSENPINKSSHISKHYDLPYIKSWRRFAGQLCRVVATWRPDLILPCDERVIAALHFIIRKKLSGQRVISDQLLQLLLLSIGNPDRFDAMILKNETRRLAIKLGMAVPEGTQVDSVASAVRVAGNLGFPVYLKSSFSWAGLGTYECSSAAEVERAFRKLNPQRTRVKDVCRFILKRDWYPKYTAIEVQRAIPGKSAMYNLLTWRGKYLGGFFATREETTGNNGPSSVVKIGANQKCEAIARKMANALGLTGFCAFDFIWDEDKQHAVLLECNPRPNQVNHLGARIGMDLCAALAESYHGKSTQIQFATRTTTVPLFPQEWLRSEQSALAKRTELDIPSSDPKLLSFMLSEGAKLGRSVAKLKLA